MLGDAAISRLAAQVAGIKQAGVREAYLRFALSLEGQQGLSLKPDSHGFIEKELRFYSGEDWYFSAVLNSGWVLFYFRNPAFRDALFDRSDVLTRFPEAEATKAKDIKLRVYDLEAATNICQFILERYKQA